MQNACPPPHPNIHMHSIFVCACICTPVCVFMHACMCAHSLSLSLLGNWTTHWYQCEHILEEDKYLYFVPCYHFEQCLPDDMCVCVGVSGCVWVCFHYDWCKWECKFEVSFCIHLYSLNVFIYLFYFIFIYVCFIFTRINHDIDVTFIAACMWFNLQCLIPLVERAIFCQRQ